LDETIPYIPDFQGGLFDMHFDSTTAFALREIGRGDRAASELLTAVQQRAVTGFPEHAAFMLYAENHDETRYVVECGDDAALAAAGALATLPGAPMVYAGQELGQRGRRDPLAWTDSRPEFREAYEELLAARSEHPPLAAEAPLSETAYDVVAGDPERVVAYERDGSLVVALNFGAEPAVIDPDGTVDGTCVVTGEDRRGDGGLRVADFGVFERM